MTETKRRKGPVPRPRTLISLPLGPEQAESLRILAEEMDLPLVGVIRKAVDAFLQAKQREGKGGVK